MTALRPGGGVGMAPRWEGTTALAAVAACSPARRGEVAPIDAVKDIAQRFRHAQDSQEAQRVLRISLRGGMT
jgi:hypothetical protein